MAALWLIVAFLNRGTALSATAVGTGMALAATLLLTATGRRQGGSLLPSGEP